MLWSCHDALIVIAAASLTAAASADAALPAPWLSRWSAPFAADRPLQIIHGIEPDARTPMSARMAHYRDLGLGGVVCNVSFTDYLRSEEKWHAFVEGVRALRALGMVVWIYDEKGYPSGSAGGLVLKAHPEYEAQELAYDASLPDPFVVRPAYEFTHASNNFAAARHYINLIDDRAVREFIRVTHQAYYGRLGGELMHGIDAFFTDEPSLITVDLGQIPESARKTVPVEDPLDPTVKRLPAVPWVYDLPERYRERWGEDLMPVRRSLFSGDTEPDRKVRRQFWSLIADLTASRYFEQIRQWCAHEGVASSGHTLWEESLIHHPTLEGSALKCLSRMDIPGLDMLSSDPETAFGNGWITAGLPSSAAMLTGRRDVMTEVSDFSEKMAGRGAVSLDMMRATAAWQSAFGVTDFTLYYSPRDRFPEDYRAYGDFVGRLNAILKPARLDADVLLYYPIYDMWPEYRPVAQRLDLRTQSPRAQRIVGSFMRLGSELTRGQTPFALIDHDFLARATVRRDGALAIKGHAFRALVLPTNVELPPGAARTVERFRQAGGLVLRDTPGLIDALKPAYRLTPTSATIVLGRFTRDGRPILLVGNMAAEAYSGAISVPASDWTRLDPASGEVAGIERDASGNVALALAAHQTVLLIGGR